MARFGVSIAVTEESTEQRPEYKQVVPGVYRLEINTAQVDRKNEGTTDEAATFNATIDVIEPEELKGGRIFGRYQLVHPKPIVQDIGQRQFSQLRRALGFGDVDADMEESEVIDEMRLVPFVATAGYGKPYQKKIDGVLQTNDDGTPLMVTSIEIKKYHYPDLNDAPAIGVTAAAANDNKRPAAPAAKPATAAAAAKKKNPWEK